MKLYEESLLKKYQKKYQRSLIIAYILLAIEIIFIIFSLIFINRNNYQPLVFIFASIATLLSFAIIYFFTIEVNQSKKYVNHFKYVLENDSLIIKGKINYINNRITYNAFGLPVLEVEVDDGEKEKIYHVLSIFKGKIKASNKMKTIIISSACIKEIKDE